MAQWTSAPNAHVRRLTSEGARPRLPWAKRLEDFVADPEPILNLVEPLRSDASAHVPLASRDEHRPPSVDRRRGTLDCALVDGAQVRPSHTLSTSGGASRLVRTPETVQYEREAKLKLIAEVVPGFQDVLRGEFHQMWILAGGELLGHPSGELGHVLTADSGEVHLLEGEAINVGVDEGVGMAGQLDREPGLAQAPEDGVVVAKRCGSGGRRHWQAQIRGSCQSTIRLSAG